MSLRVGADLLLAPEETRDPSRRARADPLWYRLGSRRAAQIDRASQRGEHAAAARAHAAVRIDRAPIARRRLVVEIPRQLCEQGETPGGWLRCPLTTHCSSSSLRRSRRAR